MRVPGGQRLESPLVRLWQATSKPTVSDRVGAREKIDLNDYMRHSLELISRRLHACFGYYCNMENCPGRRPQAPACFKYKIKDRCNMYREHLYRYVYTCMMYRCILRRTNVKIHIWNMFVYRMYHKYVSMYIYVCVYVT